MSSKVTDDHIPPRGPMNRGALASIGARERAIRAHDADGFRRNWSATPLDEWLGDTRAVRGIRRSTRHPGHRRSTRVPPHTTREHAAETRLARIAGTSYG